MSSKNKIDYAKKEVFIGIDVHKRTYSLAAVCEGALVKKGHFFFTCYHLFFQRTILSTYK